MDYDKTDSQSIEVPGMKRNFQKWILPNNPPKKPQFPCRKQKKWWDVDGVHYLEDDSESCQGLETSATDRPKYPSFQASHGKLLSEPNQYTWLFDKVRGSQHSNAPLSGSTITPFWE